MKRILPVITILVILATVLPPVDVTTVSAQAQAAPASKPVLDGDVVCLPGAYLQQPADCTPVGPSATLTGMAKVGITVPPQPLPVKRTPLDLASIPFRYVEAKTGSFPTYSTLADAINKNAYRTIPAGHMIYLSYSQRVDNGNGLFYQIQTGEWVSGNDMQQRITPSTYYQGVTVSRTPRTDFGWVLDNKTASVTTPGYNSPKTGKVYGRFDMVTAYAVQSADGVPWVQIGPNEWIEDRLVGRVMPMYAPPDGVKNGRWIEVNLAEQTLSVYDNSQMVFATLMSSGLPPFYTRPGLFQIYKKLDAEQMTGTFEADHSDYYYLENVPWTMYFDAARAIHGTYWHTLFGYLQSHGCVNLAIADAKWVFNWAKNGDYVYVWDPTGKTPTNIPAGSGP